MDKPTKGKLLITIAFFGGLWGLSEAVLGYVLHMLPPGIQGFVMFPIGFYFMHRAYKRTQKPLAIFLVGAIAAGIKLFDLFLPVVPVLRTVNPAVCILFEAVMVFVVFKVFSPASKGFIPAAALIPSITWRILYIALTYTQTLFGIPSGTISAGWGAIANMVLLEGMANAAVILVYMLVERAISRRSEQKVRLFPGYSIAAVILALGATLALPLL